MIDVVLYGLALVGALTILGALALAGWIGVSIARAALRHQREHERTGLLEQLREHDERVDG